MTFSRSLYLATAAALAFVGCSSLSVKPSDGVDAWPISGADVARSSRTEYRIDPPLHKVWEFDLGAGTGAGSALVSGPVAFVGTRKGQLLAVDLQRGKRVGRARFDVPIEGGMAFAGRTLLVAGSKRRSAIQGIDVTRGKVLWKVATSSVDGGVLALDSLVVFVDAGATLRVLDAATGSERWAHPLDTLAYVIGAPASDGVAVYVANEEGVVFAVDVLRRQRLWRAALDAPVYQSLAVGGGVVFVPTTRGRLIGLDARSGQRRWEVATPDSTVRFAPPAFDAAEHVIVAGATDGKLRAIGVDSGEVLWDADLGAPVVVAPLVTARTIYAGTLDRRLVALDRRSGLSLWEYEMPGRVQSALAASEETILVLSEPQRLIAFRVAEEEQAE
jgi:outer membrane protein assembly factor BamB